MRQCRGNTAIPPIRPQKISDEPGLCQVNEPRGRELGQIQDSSPAEVNTPGWTRELALIGCM